MTKNVNIEHLNRNALIFEIGDTQDSISLVEEDFLTYIPMENFRHMLKQKTVNTLSATAVKDRSWKETK